MTDDLDRLRTALKSHPAPDGAAKAEALRLAMENFDRHQESAKASRPIQDRPDRAGVLQGVREMISRLTTRPALAATASVVAIGVAIAVYPELRRSVPAPSPVTTATSEAEIGETRARQSSPEVGRDDRTALDNLATLTEPTAPAITAPPRPEPAPEADALADMPIAPAAPPLRKEAAAAQSGIVAEEAFRPSPSGDVAGYALPEAEPVLAPAPLTEAYPEADPNPVKVTAEEPVSTFSIDTDTASYAVVRSSLTNGYLPPAEAVRVEEMVNYFPYAYPAPGEGDAPFRASVSLFETPWNAETRLLRIGLQGELPATDDRPPLDLVFLIDTSGSMDDPKKLPLLKQSLALMLGELRPEDRIAIVTYAGSAGLVLEPTEAADRATILAALDRLDAGGSTAGAEGLQQAYQTAESMAENGRIGRILLATDGDFNVGIHDPEELKHLIARKRESGIYLSVLGFGRGNLDDATMQALAQNGNGTAAYIDTLAEAQKVLVDQLSGALFPIADDVKIQIEFNPAAVAEYRLIGYETRALAREDFNNDRVDAGEIGAGHQVTALYEITPVGSPARQTDPLRYAEQQLAGDAAELGFLKLRYKAPGAATSRLIETPIPIAPAEAESDARFAAAIAGMGQLLSDPKYLGQWGWDDAIALAAGARGDDPYGYRAEAVQLMRLAQSLSR
ncbi:von Willebrand factor type A domain-containing protein [Defluviimonas sp. D31]|uniref:vWA domain-containing protein n=1 Tax=Defluviimonas sp. D31 TaxID=3083253 RepID=UPI00296E6AF9|nr:von Willebrand factor type A domain-containing protein [Defluviimonas sp. D31]MDW4549946.1 von Willebrand factor type A domain-containing protein [Defluviimonas sp. D31]